MQLFGKHASGIHSERKTFAFRFRSAEHGIEIFRNFYGPAHKAFAALDAGRQRALHEQLVGLLTLFNRSGQKGLVVPGEYREVVVTRRG